MNYQRINLNSQVNVAGISTPHKNISPSFTDQRLSAALQLKQQAMIRAAHENTMQCFSFGPSSTVIQRSDVTATGVDDDESLTPDKKIKTRNSSEAWFRFSKDGLKIDTFATNITTSSPKGDSPVAHGKAFDLDDDAKLQKYDIGSLSRAQHFAGGDRLAGSSASTRKGKWTWHHKQDPYYMELVDMAVHRSFYHHGGFSKWQEGADDDNDD